MKSLEWRQNSLYVNGEYVGYVSRCIGGWCAVESFEGDDEEDETVLEYGVTRAQARYALERRNTDD